ncbi:MAG: hypothetical protein QW751_00335 [Candidatus Aenigmatarchaeota archaeon]
MQKVALLVFAILVVAACVQLPFGRQQVGIPGETHVENPDMNVEVVAFPAEVKGGRNISVTWNITNKQTTNRLWNVNINVYDQCLFSGDATKHFDELRENRTQTWTWRWSSQTTQFERDCNIKFKVSWESNATIIQDINVLSSTEYYTREQTGTLAAMAGTTTASTNPVTITLRFSDPLPWENNTTVYMYIDIADTGGGFIDKLPKGSIRITLPNNLKGDCDGYKPKGNELILDRDLNFINKMAPSLTCTFQTTTDRPISTGTLSITANYKYDLDNSFTVKVKTK